MPDIPNEHGFANFIGYITAALGEYEKTIFRILLACGYKEHPTYK